MPAIKRCQLLTLLKNAGKYEKKFFTLKKIDLEKVCEDLGLDISKSPEKVQSKPVKSNAKPVKKKVQILELSDSSESESESEEDTEVEQEEVVVLPKKVKKKAGGKLTRRKKEEDEHDPKNDQDHKESADDIASILRKYSVEVRLLMKEYDYDDLDEYDINYVKTTFNQMTDSVENKIDIILGKSDFSKAEISKIEQKIRVQIHKYDTFMQ